MLIIIHFTNLECLYPCANCIGNAVGDCLTCASTVTERITTSVCECISHYYETNVLATGCAICDYKCVECSTSATNCTDCSDVNRSTAPACNCDAGWFDDGE